MGRNDLVAMGGPAKGGFWRPRGGAFRWGGAAEKAALPGGGGGGAGVVEEPAGVS
eukprot:COSAG02_NODE_30012_length_558_cov_9.880174_1_plen_54_part_01